ncbi:F510_1955 family glycosylhydrolase [Paeniglutamicibacter sp. NPDC091659]|uniref:F510_1955 family glycosylhydrolase n=1 Tax=Paeniglutamicibacter sp. NPDC091659 TaxID=3364389 RepID=UPI0037FD2D82
MTTKPAIFMSAALAGVLALAGCAQSPGDAGPDTGTTAAAASTPRESGAGPAAKDPETVLGYPTAHVHAIAATDKGQVLLATHDGLYEVSANPAQRIGPVVDWMGFTLGKDGFYASGHPGPGVELENPVGLMSSTDKGKTWESLSRSGVSDFHALTASKNAIVGFDTTLRSTADGSRWKDLDPRILPATLAADPRGSLVLAATEQGVWRSTDDGATFGEPVANGPLLQYLAVSGTKAVGMTPDGVAWTSHDGGMSWKQGGRLQGTANAVAMSPDGSLIWVSSSLGVEHSADGAASFELRFASPQ